MESVDIKHIYTSNHLFNTTKAPRDWSLFDMETFDFFSILDSIDNDVTYCCLRFVSDYTSKELYTEEELQKYGLDPNANDLQKQCRKKIKINLPKSFLTQIVVRSDNSTFKLNEEYEFSRGELLTPPPSGKKTYQDATQKIDEYMQALEKGF